MRGIIKRIKYNNKNLYIYVINNFLYVFIVISCIAFSSDDIYELENNGERYGKSEFISIKIKFMF